MSDGHWIRPLGMIRRHVLVANKTLCDIWQPHYDVVWSDDDAPENCVRCRGLLERMRLREHDTPLCCYCGEPTLRLWMDGIMSWTCDCDGFAAREAEGGR
jgi:hypothetical protein